MEDNLQLAAHYYPMSLATAWTHTIWRFGMFLARWSVGPPLWNPKTMVN